MVEKIKLMMEVTEPDIERTWRVCRVLLDDDSQRIMAVDPLVSATSLGSLRNLLSRMHLAAFSTDLPLIMDPEHQHVVSPLGEPV